MKIDRISDLERKYINEVLDTGFRTSEGGVMASRLEKKFSEKFGKKYAVTFNNGTSTLHASLIAAGIGKGDKVIVPPLTMASTAIAVLQCGAIPVFCDIDPYTWNIDTEGLEYLTYDTDIKAIIPVHLYGLPCEMDKIMKGSKEMNLFVLEDSAQCFLSYTESGLAGTIGDVGSWSFQRTKHITGDELGIIVTDKKDLALDIRRFRTLGYSTIGVEKGRITKDDIQDPLFERHVSLGWNYIPSELCCALALAQLERLERFVAMRKRVASYYRDTLDDMNCEWLIQQEYLSSGCINHSYWSYVVRIDSEKGISWHDFRKEYIENGGDKFYGAWKLNYLEPMFRGKRFGKEQTQRFVEGLCPVAEEVQPWLIQFSTQYFDTEEAEKQTEALRKTIKHFGVD